MNAELTPGPSVNVQSDLFEERFRLLAETVGEECAHFSSMHAVAQHPAYRQIVEMGERALPLILRELEQKPGHWFWALREITQANPVHPEHRGVVAEMAQDWLDWARGKGMQW